MILKNRSMLSFLMAIVMVLTIMPFYPLEARAADTPTFDPGIPVRLSETTYQLSNATFGTTGVVNAAGGYFTVVVNNGRIDPGILPSGITELTNGIIISGITTDRSTITNRVFNFSGGTTYEDIQDFIQNLTFTQDAGQSQSVTVNVTPGAQLADGKTSVRTYDGRYFVYVARQTATLSFKEAVTIAADHGGHLVEPTAGNPGEMFAIASMFKEFRSPSPWSGDGGIWHFLSFIGVTKTQAPDWASPYYTETRYVTHPDQQTNLEATLLPNGDPTHVTLMIDNDVTKIGYLPVNNTHGDTSVYKDPGVIVEYNSGEITNIFIATKVVASFSGGIESASGEVTAANNGSGTITATPNDVSTVMTVTNPDGSAVTGLQAFDQDGNELVPDVNGWYPSNGSPIIFKPLMPGGNYKVAASTTFEAGTTIPSEATETESVALPTVGNNVAAGKDTGHPGKTTITVNPSSTLARYAIADADGNVVSDWVTGTGSDLTFDNLDPGTTYQIVTVPADMTGEPPTTELSGTSVTTPEYPVMAGIVSISGTAKAGHPLTADLSEITYTPDTSGNVPTYQWYRDGVAITDATGSSYTLTEDDLGANITVQVTADGIHATGSVTSAATAKVEKADGPASPSAPVEAGKTATSITLTGVAGQEYSMDGGLTWQVSPTFSGLTPDTEYAFVTRVKATETQNASAISEAVKIRTVASTSNGNNGGNTGGNTGGNNSGSTPTPTPPTTPTTPTKPVESGIETSVNDKDGTFATGKTSTSEGRTTTSVQVDLNKLNEALAPGNGQKLMIHSPENGDLKVDGLTAGTVKQLADKNANLEISNPLAIYPVPGGKMDLDSVSKQLGNSALNDIAVQINVSRSADTLIQSAKNKATSQGYELLVNPVDLDLTFTNSGKTARSGQLNGYAPKYIALPEGIDPNRITTGVIVNPDGSVFHVPTVVVKINGRYYAQINDLRSHGSYSVIWNPRDFDDVKNHWGKVDVNNVAARLDLEGTGNNAFLPNRNVTRSEFADIVVLGLGLMRQDVPQNIFPDVTDSAWYRASVAIANEFGIVRGYNDGSFYGNQEITREQGFSMIARAYRLIDSGAALSEEQATSALAGYKDAPDVSAWAKADVAQLIAAEIIQGNGPEMLSPKEPMTRAEVTALIARMLKITDVIDK
ncbi:S-layer homology domain-containing protein [Paenibacillus sp. NPDC057886]|uniref:S-layer homology domain-containing protein n=1 Tax=Paenibacillus sp. NPDC057886 TaxID=3346270 RepID=UPI003680D330